MGVCVSVCVCEGVLSVAVRKKEAVLVSDDEPHCSRNAMKLEQC